MQLLHLIFIWQPVVSWILFVIDVLLMCWLMYNAYANGQSLNRYQFPLVGKIAYKWVESE